MHVVAETFHSPSFLYLPPHPMPPVPPVPPGWMVLASAQLWWDRAPAPWQGVSQSQEVLPHGQGPFHSPHPAFPRR